MVGKFGIIILLVVLCCQGLEISNEKNDADIDIPPKTDTDEEGKPFPGGIQQEDNKIGKRGWTIVGTFSIFTGYPRSHELANVINQYRSENGLPAIPISNSLMRVATLHVKDSHFKRESQCNLHSWSSNGTWTACCYTPDHVQARCMWQKPREIAQFPGNGYEISAFSTSLDPKLALSLWQRSPGHNDVILNKGIWARRKWQALGAAIDGTYAHAWFSDVADSKN